MTEFEVVPKCGGPTKTFESRRKAEDGADTHDALCGDCTKGDSEVNPVQEAETDGGTTTEESETARNAAGEVVKQVPGPGRSEEDMQPVEETIPENPSVAEDPLDWVPGHFVDEIQGVPTINRKGYAVLAANFNVSVVAEPVTLPSETGFEYAAFRAIATTEDGQEYSGFGSAHIDRQDGDDKHLLAELAETRALKRATAWATGVGLTAVEEMKGGVE